MSSDIHIQREKIKNKYVLITDNEERKHKNIESSVKLQKKNIFLVLVSKSMRAIIVKKLILLIEVFKKLLSVSLTNWQQSATLFVYSIDLFLQAPQM